MKRLAVVLTFCSITAFGQGEEEAVKATINRFFEGLRTSDSTLIKASLAPSAIFQTIVQERDGQPQVRTEVIQRFITAVTQPHPEVYDERIVFDVIKIDGALAAVWTPYKFYVGTTLSHCGANSFQLVKLAGAWKIHYIIDTRRKNPCP
jgi:hypothetical protein